MSELYVSFVIDYSSQQEITWHALTYASRRANRRIMKEKRRASHHAEHINADVFSVEVKISKINGDEEQGHAGNDKKMRNNAGNSCHGARHDMDSFVTRQKVLRQKTQQLAGGGGRCDHARPWGGHDLGLLAKGHSEGRKRSLGQKEAKGLIKDISRIYPDI